MRRFAGSLLLGLTACSVGFDVTVSGEAVVPQGSLLTCAVAPVFPGFSGFDISDTEQFQNQGASKQNLQSVTLDSLQLVVADPSDGGLGFLEELDFFAQDPSGNLPTVQIAHATDFSGNPQSVEMVVDGAELAPYAELPSMNLSSTASLQACPAENTTLQANVVLHVVAK